ncbi:MAG: hypothetical protein AB9883_07605 [Acidaminococcaceae bacterium]
MDAQNALFYLKRSLEELELAKKEKTKSIPEFDLAIGVHIACISALDKRIFKKPLIAEDKWFCPNCRQFVGVIYPDSWPYWTHKNFCPYCGQALGEVKDGR